MTLRSNTRMEVQNGKITEITKSELYNIYIDREMYQIMSFDDYEKQFKKLGVKILEDEN